MSKEDVSKQIEALIVGIGAVGEYLGLLKTSLVKNGFTNEEAVTICSQLLSDMTLRGNKGNKDN